MSAEKKIDTRAAPDRRKRPTPLFSRYSISGRRRAARRESDKKCHCFVDAYDKNVLISVLSLLMLCLLDAYFTLLLTRVYGMTEINPLMASCLDLGNLSFFGVKYAISALSILIFCLFNNFYVAKISLASSIVVYLVLVSYELAMIRSMMN